ncbi:MAG: hypothetical protein KAU49_05195 [Candidatus Krumholzibacteria bacterium]|nr:hypothetical protein [Candidatus Krumholzibacteria bacterium]
MKTKANLWVRLKVIDLVAQTAWMTLTEKMGFAGDLCGILRYSYWAMEAEGENASAVCEAIDREIRMDSAFTNQNKHLYSLAVTSGGDGAAAGDLSIDRDFPRVKCGGRIFACDLFVSEQGGGKDEGYASRLNARLSGAKVTGMKSGEVWRILVRAEDAEEAARKVEEMAVTRSRKHGLLLNPHYQAFEFIGTAEIDGQ